MTRFLVLFFALAVAGCASVPVEDTPTRASTPQTELPAMNIFERPQPMAPARSNSNIAADFLDLHFQLESGRTLPTFTRFETPVTVRVTGHPPSSFGPDLVRLLMRLRKEAGIDIKLVNDPNASLTIEVVPRADIQKALPKAACFVVPNVSSLREYRNNRRSPRTDWTKLQSRDRLAIFVPGDASPQELRDCLHEELAQAIGPAQRSVPPAGFSVQR